MYLLYLLQHEGRCYDYILFYESQRSIFFTFTLPRGGFMSFFFSTRGGSPSSRPKKYKTSPSYVSNERCATLRTLLLYSLMFSLYNFAASGFAGEFGLGSVRRLWIEVRMEATV